MDEEGPPSDVVVETAFDAQPALVSLRMYEHSPVPARLSGAVLYSDQVYWRHGGPRRYFWLVEEDVQMVYEPFGWRDEWYVDVVSFERSEHAGLPVFTVHDRYVDFVVKGDGADLSDVGPRRGRSGVAGRRARPDGVDSELVGGTALPGLVRAQGRSFPAVGS